LMMASPPPPPAAASAVTPVAPPVAAAPPRAAATQPVPPQDAQLFLNFVQSCGAATSASKNNKNYNATAAIGVAPPASSAASWRLLCDDENDAISSLEWQQCHFQLNKK
jgi:hypothetical protein